MHIPHTNLIVLAIRLLFHIGCNMGVRWVTLACCQGVRGVDLEKFYRRGRMVVKQALALGWGVVAQQKVSLSIEKFLGKLKIPIEKDLARGKSRMYSHHPI